MKKIAFALIAVAALAAAACNTVQGAGKDVQSLGQAIEKVAQPKAAPAAQ